MAGVCGRSDCFGLPVGSKVAGLHVVVPPLDAASYPHVYSGLAFFVANIRTHIQTRWCPPVTSWFITPINYRYMYHRPKGGTGVIGTNLANHGAPFLRLLGATPFGGVGSQPANPIFFLGGYLGVEARGD